VCVIDSADAGSFLCSFRFALSILCSILTMNVYAQRMGMSVAVVCMVNHTAVVMMRDAHSFSGSSSSGSNLTTVATPGEWKNNESEDAIEQLRSPCAANLAAGSNRSRATVIIMFIITLADPGLSFGGRSSAEGAEGLGFGENRCPPPQWGEVWGHSWGSRNFLDFLPRNGAFCVHSDT